MTGPAVLFGVHYDVDDLIARLQEATASDGRQEAVAADSGPLLLPPW